MKDSRLSKRLLYKKSAGKISVGGPRLGWLDSVEANTTFLVEEFEEDNRSLVGVEALLRSAHNFTSTDEYYFIFKIMRDLFL